MKTDYDKQADDFLKATGSMLKIELSEFQNGPIWATGEAYGTKYTVTLSNARGSYTFPFWDSINNRQYMDALNLIKNSKLGEPRTSEYYRAQDLLKSKDALGLKRGLSMGDAYRNYDKYVEQLKPSAYSVLACLDVDYSDDFADFCANYGYDTDSIKAKETYDGVIEQDRQLRRIFTLEELEMLQEVQ